MNAPEESRASQWIGHSLKVALGLILALLAIRIGTALWLKNYLGDSIDDLARVSGMDASIAGWLKGFAVTVAALSLASLLLRWLAGLTLPGFDSARTLRLSLIAAGISGFAVCSPVIVRTIRGVDRQGLPRLLQRVDPEQCRWFTPDHQALISVSFERDGHWEFWNRPGTTPQSAIQAVPVTAEIRKVWEIARAKEREAKARETREAEDKARREEALREQSRIQEEILQKQQRQLEQTRRDEIARKDRTELEARVRRLDEEARDQRATQEEIRSKYDALLREQAATREKAKAAASAPATKPATPHTGSLPWQTHIVRAGWFLYVDNYISGNVEIRIPFECVVQVQGGPPMTCSAGVTRLRLTRYRGFRVSSRVSRDFEIQSRPVSNP